MVVLYFILEIIQIFFCLQHLQVLPHIACRLRQLLSNS